MLQFLRRSSQSSGSSDGKKSQSKQLQKRSSLGNLQAATVDAAHGDKYDGDLLLDENYGNYCELVTKDNNTTPSRLSRNLRDIISNKDCLCYFVQFLEMKNSLASIKFYIDAENFKKAADICFSVTANKPHQCQHLEDNSVDNDFCIDQKFNDSLSFKSFDPSCDRMSVISSHSQENFFFEICEQPELKELECVDRKDHADSHRLNDEDSMCNKPLTDDEKSQIFKRNTAQKEGNYSTTAALRVNSKIKPCDKNLDKAITSIATDAIRIYKKYFTSTSVDFIDIPATNLSSISLALCTATPQSELFEKELEDKELERDSESTVSTSPKPIQSTIFQDAQHFVFDQLERLHLKDFLDSLFYCKYSIDVLSSQAFNLNDILQSESVLFYFMEYLEQELKRNYLEFWMAATQFQNHYTNNQFEKAEAQSDAMILYDKYFSLQATCPLRVSDSVRSSVEVKICTDDEEIKNAFDLPIRIVEKYLQEEYLPGFLSSNLFNNYLNELRSRIHGHMTPEYRSSMKKRRHRKTLSDCTSDTTIGLIRNKFISHQNTLLAMESLKVKTAVTRTNSGDMHIDLRQLQNPDLLWRRKTICENSGRSGLTFGRVDALGRYERDFEMETIGDVDNKWSLATGGNRLKSAVRKLVNLPEDKVQEEIAWQVAEMIVKDITSVTLNSDSAGGPLPMPLE